jgi:hypothetical protein
MLFKDLEVGSQFNYKSGTYTKIPPEKISCCKSLNAVNLETKEKIMVPPKEDVEVTTSEEK